ncbi:fungal-specific transcription factor domain-containing protein [Dendryphion nanum]|uniref:Fungal-specific transcription factor domain-containing protein n=1 Tax=Dendryphion nanum TaxID=256645 RepID=A0A9P9EJF7_9PLEO|nr:fungal-specific transcription factor domain-containing protein [Dendryphion nanum]
MAPKGCWTCKDRKVRCDRGLPTCSNCIKTNRECRGYGVRLSWPTQDDAKRSIVVPVSQTCRRRVRGSGKVKLVNASFWDIEMHHNLTTHAMENRKIISQIRFPRIVPWCPHNLESTDTELVDYFSSVASNSLAAFGQSTATIKRALIRMALVENTPSSRAVLQSMLAFSQLHRDGCQVQTYKYVKSALRNLTSTANANMTKHQAAQHMCAGMILCSAHILRDWDGPFHWIWYICSSKEIAKTVGMKWLDSESDALVILRWVYYHDVLSRFSLRHWRFRAGAIERYYATFKRRPTFCEPIDFPRMDASAFDVLHYLLQFFTSVANSSDSRYHSEEYREKMKALKEAVMNIPTTKIVHQDDSTEATVATDTLLEIYRLATLIYLERQSNNFSGLSEEIATWIEQALPLLAQLNGYDQPFPLFVIGCEARTDEQRDVILELISRTEAISRSRNLQYVTHVIQAIWVQDDLADGTLDYSNKLDSIFGAVNILPSFA